MGDNKSEASLSRHNRDDYCIFYIPQCMQQIVSFRGQNSKKEKTVVDHFRKRSLLNRFALQRISWCIGNNPKFSRIASFPSFQQQQQIEVRHFSQEGLHSLLLPADSFLTNASYRSFKEILKKLSYEMNRAQALLVRKNEIPIYSILSTEKGIQSLISRLAYKINNQFSQYKTECNCLAKNYDQTYSIPKKFVREIDNIDHIYDQRIDEALQSIASILRLNRLRTITAFPQLPVIQDHHHMEVGIGSLEKSLKQQQQRLLRSALISLFAFFQARQEEDAFIDNEILQYIHETCERNNTLRADLAHFLVPYAVLLKMLQVRSPVYKQSTYITKNIHFILRKVQKPEIMHQTHPTVHEPFFHIITKADTYQQLHNFMRMVLEREKSLMVRVVPYYYNFFALVINQRVYFRGSREVLLEYTVPFEVPTLNPLSVRWEHIHKAIATMQAALRKKYHSEKV